MKNVETFPSKQMYPYISLVERKEAEVYHNIDRRRNWFGYNDFFHRFFQTIDGVLDKVNRTQCTFMSPGREHLHGTWHLAHYQNLASGVSPQRAFRMLFRIAYFRLLVHSSQKLKA